MLIQGKNWRRVGVFDPLEQWLTLWKSAKMLPGQYVLDNLQLNNCLTHSNFRYFTIPGKISKYNPLEKFDPPCVNPHLYHWQHRSHHTQYPHTKALLTYSGEIGSKRGNIFAGHDIVLTQRGSNKLSNLFLWWKNPVRVRTYVPPRIQPSSSKPLIEICNPFISFLTTYNYSSFLASLLALHTPPPYIHMH